MALSRIFQPSQADSQREVEKNGMNEKKVPARTLASCEARTFLPKAIDFRRMAHHPTTYNSSVATDDQL